LLLKRHRQPQQRADVVFFVPATSPREMGNTQTFQKVRLAVYRLAGAQLLLATLIAGGAGFIAGQQAALSVITGAVIGMLAALYQAQRMLRVDASTHPERFMSGVYVGEAMKIVVTVALLIAAIRLLRVEMVPTIVGYASTYIVYWGALATAFPWIETPNVEPMGYDNDDWD
jgi:F0F1-type ATP synthase assembly protein I